MKSIEFAENEIWFIEKALLRIRDKTTLHMDYFRAIGDAEAEYYYHEEINKINQILDKIAGEEGGGMTGMKILKPGKAEMRKFVCPKCGCEFLAAEQEKYLAHVGYYQLWVEVQCPCGKAIKWDKGEPYEEPTQDDRERLDRLIRDLFNHESISRECIVDYLIRHGVTFRD